MKHMLSLIPAASSLRDIVCKLFYILVQKRFTKQLGTLTRCKAQWRRLKTGDNPTEGLTPTSTLAAWHSEVAASLKVSQDDQVMSSGQKILRQVQSYVLFFKENICIEKYLQVLRWDSAHFRFPTPFLSSQLRKRVEGRIAWSAVSLSAPSKHTWKKRQVSRTRVRIVSSAHLSSQEEIIKSVLQPAEALAQVAAMVNAQLKAQ